MWIDTAGTLPAGSQLTVLPAPDYHASSPYIHAPQSSSNQTTGLDLLCPFKIPPRSQVYTFSTPDRVRDPAI
ncbi:hypothetical protein BASA61_003033 [Batrachochytrium salamandrivorans]|nr:hypothetical protein BASA61_003033 [Batrachochytrium salamandrivorans]